MTTNGYSVTWEELVGSGSGLSPRTLQEFAHPGETTHALLTLNGAVVPGGDFASGENHAEYELLHSAAWADTLDAVGGAGTSARVGVVINRTPCHFVFGRNPWMEGEPAAFFATLEESLPTERIDRPWRGCSLQLASALKDFWRAYPDARKAGVEFVLACRGYYAGRQFSTRAYRRHQAATTTFDLGCLIEAGWKLRALAVDQTLSERGEALANVLPRVEAWVSGGR